MAACVAVAAAVLLGTGTVLILDAVHHKGAATASAATVGPTAAGQVPLSANSHQGVTPSPSATSSGQQHIGLINNLSGSPTPTPSQQGQGGQGGGPPSSRPSPTPGRTQPSPSPSQSPPPSPGTLSVSPGSVTLSGVPATASFTITASGGTVSYSIADPAPPGDLAVSPSAGSLLAGGSVTVSVTVSSTTGLASETDLTVNPGGLTVAVLYPGG